MSNKQQTLNGSFSLFGKGLQFLFDGVLKQLHIGDNSVIGQDHFPAKCGNIVGFFGEPVAQTTDFMSGVAHDDPATFQNANRGSVVLICIVTVKPAQAKILAGGLAAFGIQFLNMDLAHIRNIGDICQPISCHDCLFVDPPIRIGPFDS